MTEGYEEWMELFHERYWRRPPDNLLEDVKRKVAMLNGIWAGRFQKAALFFLPEHEDDVYHPLHLTIQYYEPEFEEVIYFLLEAGHPIDYHNFELFQWAPNERIFRALREHDEGRRLTYSMFPKACLRYGAHPRWFANFIAEVHRDPVEERAFFTNLWCDSKERFQEEALLITLKCRPCLFKDDVIRCITSCNTVYSFRRLLRTGVIHTGNQFVLDKIDKSSRAKDLFPKQIIVREQSFVDSLIALDSVFQ
jgi:hypothetical protein